MDYSEEVIRKTSEIEDILCDKYHAHGRTFGEIINSVRKKLSPRTIGKLNILLKVRNNIVHQGEYKFNKFRFRSLASDIIDDLKEGKRLQF